MSETDSLPDTLSLQIDATGVAQLTLRRPAAGNALDLALAAGLVQAARRCADDPAVRCVLLAAQGRFFCAGGDVAFMAASAREQSDGMQALVSAVHQAVEIFATMAKPMVCAVQGTAAGGGLGLALAGDLVLAAESAQFVAGYPNVGLSPDAGISWLLPRLIGLRRAQALLLGQTRYGAAQAEAIGLITQCVPDAELAAAALAAARQLAAGPTQALGETRALLRAAYQRELPAHLDDERLRIVAAASRSDGREGMAAFLDKRPAAFGRGG